MISWAGLVLGIAASTQSGAAALAPPVSAILEVRAYNLKKGAGGRFHELFVKESLPLLRRMNIDVVAYGPSLDGQDSYFLIRAFSGVAERARQEDAFYASPGWRNGPRAEVLAAIDNYTTTVVQVDTATLEGLRRSLSGQATAADFDQLTRLNNDYITAVNTSDVAWFAERLASDFLCTLADGSLLERAQFLEQTARPYTLRDLQAHDVNIRILGDTAIVHARTTFTLPDGTSGSGRYTDIWARRDGRWLAVAAHVTRR